MQGFSGFGFLGIGIQGARSQSINGCMFSVDLPETALDEPCCCIPYDMKV